MQISIEPYRKIVIHEVIELGFHDLIDQMINQTRAVGGATIPMLSWCNGMVFQIASFNPNSEEIIRPTGTVLLVNHSANANFNALAEVLKRSSRGRAGDS